VDIINFSSINLFFEHNYSLVDSRLFSFRYVIILASNKFLLIRFQEIASGFDVLCTGFCPGTEKLILHVMFYAHLLVKKMNGRKIIIKNFYKEL
jgi:hypothetical protein